MGIFSYFKLKNEERKTQLQKRFDEAKKEKNNDKPSKPAFTQKDFENFSSGYQIPVFTSSNGEPIFQALSSDNQFQALTDIQAMNEFLEKACSIAKIKNRLHICTEEINFTASGESQTQLKFAPYTPTGKLAKYPISLLYRTLNYNAFEPKDNYFGEIFYMGDGNIGKAELINWIGHKMYAVNLGLIGATLSIKSIKETANTSVNVIYKA